MAEETPRKTILELAEEAVSGARQEHYGHPRDNHACTANLWRVWLHRRFGVDVPITAVDVCHLNILQKASRAANVTTLDTLVDYAGFARNIDMIAFDVPEPAQPEPAE